MEKTCRIPIRYPCCEAKSQKYKKIIISEGHLHDWKVKRDYSPVTNFFKIFCRRCKFYYVITVWTEPCASNYEHDKAIVAWSEPQPLSALSSMEWL